MSLSPDIQNSLLRLAAADIGGVFPIQEKNQRTVNFALSFVISGIDRRMDNNRTETKHKYYLFLIWLKILFEVLIADSQSDQDKTQKVDPEAIKDDINYCCANIFLSLLTMIQNIHTNGSLGINNRNS